MYKRYIAIEMGITMNRHYFSKDDFGPDFDHWSRGWDKHAWAKYNHEHHNHSGKRGGDTPQARRGDIGPIVLRALLERPMHGYEIIRHLEEKSHGMWRPSAGSIYPTLQMLEEQDLVVSHDEGGKKVYELTNAGQTTAKESEARAPWEMHQQNAAQFKQFKWILFELMVIFKRIAKDGSAEKITATEKILLDTKAKLTIVADGDKNDTTSAAA